MEQEPGSAGATVIDHYARRVLNGYNFRAERSTGDKATRAQPLAAASERGLVKLIEGHWNKAFLDEIECFPYGGHDDQVDACSLAYNQLAAKREFWMHVADGQPKEGKLYDFKGDELGYDGRLISFAGVEVHYEDTPMGRQQVITFKPGVERIDIRPEAPWWDRTTRLG
jgi:hypothetical protein